MGLQVDLKNEGVGTRACVGPSLLNAEEEINIVKTRKPLVNKKDVRRPLKIGLITSLLRATKNHPCFSKKRQNGRGWH